VQAEVDGLLGSGCKRLKALPHTLGMSDAEWRVLALCHDRRNKAEYEGTLEVDDRLLAELISIGGKLLSTTRRAATFLNPEIL